MAHHPTHGSDQNRRRGHRRHQGSSAAPTAGATPGGAPDGPSAGDGHLGHGPQFDQPSPSFVEPSPTSDPTKFIVRHPSDSKAYKILDAEDRAHELLPTSFPASRGGTEPTLTLEQVLGPSFAPTRLATIQQAGRLIFHAVGDTGNVRSVEPQNLVADKLVSDFNEQDAGTTPSFLFHLGDVVYNFGEAQYYYDQFYEPYRDYPAPILAIAGNHDGIVSPLNNTGVTLEAFLKNFCAETYHVTQEAGGLDRTAQIQPGVYFTFEAPRLRILALYTNTLEDPGVLSSQGGQFPAVPDIQLDYLRAALTRAKGFDGALLIAHHHPTYTYGSKHGWSIDVRREIDKICEETGVWPHAVLSAHAHNYQRFTRDHGGMEIPYLVAGGGGHGLGKLVRKGEAALRTPMPVKDPDGDQVTFENYDDQNYGYLRIIVTATQLRIEYHPAEDGTAAKTPDDSVTVDLATHKIVRFTG